MKSALSLLQDTIEVAIATSAIANAKNFFIMFVDAHLYRIRGFKLLLLLYVLLSFVLNGRAVSNKVGDFPSPSVPRSKCPWGQEGRGGSVCFLTLQR